MNILAQPARNQKLLKAGKAVIIALLIAAAMAEASSMAIQAATTGSKTQLAMSFFIALLPLLLYLSITKPFIFPFALFVVAIPVDNLLAVTALTSGTGGSSAHVSSITRFLGLTSGLAFVFWLVRNRRCMQPPRAVLMWLALLVWMSLSVFWAMDTDVAVGSLMTYAQLIVLYFVISIMPLTVLEFRTLLAAVVLGALVAAAYSIYHFHAGGNQFHGELGAQLSSRLLRKPEREGIDPNALTTALLLPIAIVITAALQRRWSFAKVAFLGMLLVLLGGVYVTASRGGIVALGALLAYLLLRSRYKMQVFAYSLLALGASLARGISSGSMWGRFADIAKSGGSGRLSIWAVGWNSFKHHWLAGAGVGNFQAAYRQSFIHVYEFVNQGWNRVSHNTPLGLAVELGVIGLLLAVAAGYQQWRMLSFITKSDPLYDLRIALESAVIGLFVSSVFMWALSGKYTWLTFELMAATRAFALCRTDWYNAQPRPPIVRALDGISHPEHRPKVPVNA